MNFGQVLILCFVAVLGYSNGQEILSAHWKCSGWFCVSMAVELATVDPRSGKFTDIVEFVAPESFYFTETYTSVSAYFPATQTYFLAVTDGISRNTTTLFSYSVATKSHTQIQIPFRYGGFDLNTMEYVPAVNMLAANYGPNMFLIEPYTGHYEFEFEIFSPDEYRSGSVSCYDKEHENYYLQVFDKSGKCFWLYSVNMLSREVTISNCFPLQGAIGLDPLLYYLSPYNGQKLLAIMQNSLGGSVVLLNPMTGDTTMVYDTPSFKNRGWVLPKSSDTITYDASTHTLWFLVMKEQDKEYFAGVNVQTSEAVDGGVLGEAMFKNFRANSKK